MNTFFWTKGRIPFDIHPGNHICKYIRQCFSTFLGSRHHFWQKNFWQHPHKDKLLLLCPALDAKKVLISFTRNTNNWQENLIFGDTVVPLYGTLVCQGTPVENHWSGKKFHFSIESSVMLKLYVKFCILVSKHFHCLFLETLKYKLFANIVKYSLKKHSKENAIICWWRV